MCLGTLANFPQNGHLRANLRSSQTRKVEDGAGECLNLSCFFHYCDKGLFFFFLLYLLLTSEAARKTPITQSKSPSATSPSSHRSSLSPWFDGEASQQQHPSASSRALSDSLTPAPEATDSP